MGREYYEEVGFGMTEREAYKNAVDIDREENGHQEGYSGTIGSATGEECKSKCLIKPKIAKQCNVEKNKQEGARKWVTVYEVNPFLESYRRHDNCIVVKSSQGDAMKKAKEMALEHNCAFIIDIKKEISNGTSRIASVSPKNSTTGKWLFTGLARC